MSDATLVAGEIQDLAQSVSEVAEAIKAKKEQQLHLELPAPVLNVVTPEQPAPIVNVPQGPAPEVTVNVDPTPVKVEAKIDVKRAEPVGYIVRITERDPSGYIAKFVIEPIPGSEILEE